MGSYESSLERLLARRLQKSHKTRHGFFLVHGQSSKGGCGVCCCPEKSEIGISRALYLGTAAMPGGWESPGPAAVLSHAWRPTLVACTFHLCLAPPSLSNCGLNPSGRAAVRPGKESPLRPSRMQRPRSLPSDTLKDHQKVDKSKDERQAGKAWGPSSEDEDDRAWSRREDACRPAAISPLPF